MSETETKDAVVEAAETAVEAAAAEAETAAAKPEAEAAPAKSMEDLGSALEESLEKGPQNDDPVWDKFENMLKEKTVFPVKVENSVKGGVVAFVDNVRGFIPASKLSNGYVENLDDFAGKTIDVIVITADRAAKRLVMSARDVIRMKEREARKAAIESCSVGDVLEGTVDTLTDYGAFINLENGASGLLHVSQISFKRVEKPSDVLEKGQKVKVKVIAIKDGKLSLSIKALQDNGHQDRAPRADRGDRDSRGGRRHEHDEEHDMFGYKETGKATTNLGDLLKNVKLK